MQIGVLACTWVAQAYRRDIPGFQTDVHACSLMPTKSIQYCRRAAAIEDQQGTVPCEQLPLQAEETRLLSCKRKCQREELDLLNKYGPIVHLALTQRPAKNSEEIDVR